MNEMLASNLQQNLAAVVKVCVRWVEQLSAGACIKMFESYKSYQGTYMFLHEIIELSQDAEVHFKYIEAAAKLGQISEVERIVRQSNSYEPERVRDFLKVRAFTFLHLSLPRLKMIVMLTNPQHTTSFANCAGGQVTRPTSFSYCVRQVQLC